MCVTCLDWILINHTFVETDNLVCPVFPDCSVDHLWQSDSITA